MFIGLLVRWLEQHLASKIMYLKFVFFFLFFVNLYKLVAILLSYVGTVLMKSFGVKGSIVTLVCMINSFYTFNNNLSSCYKLI